MVAGLVIGLISASNRLEGRPLGLQIGAGPPCWFLWCRRGPSAGLRAKVGGGLGWRSWLVAQRGAGIGHGIGAKAVVLEPLLQVISQPSRSLAPSRDGAPRGPAACRCANPMGLRPEAAPMASSSAPPAAGEGRGTTRRQQCSGGHAMGRRSAAPARPRWRFIAGAHRTGSCSVQSRGQRRDLLVAEPEPWSRQGEQAEAPKP